MYAGPQPWTDGCKPAVSKVRAVDHQGNVVVHEQLFNPGPVGGHPSPYLKVTFKEN
jgi:hypothetical protein